MLLKNKLIVASIDVLREHCHKVHIRVAGDKQTDPILQRLKQPDGNISFNVGQAAVVNYQSHEDFISFTARFNGQGLEIFINYEDIIHVNGIDGTGEIIGYVGSARAAGYINDQFIIAVKKEETEPQPQPEPPVQKRPMLKVVK